MSLESHENLWGAVTGGKPAQKDAIYADPKDVRPFEFNREVVKVFPDMIGRSVPGYYLATELLGNLVRRFAQPDTRIYDLGCSLGAVSWTIQHHMGANTPEIVAVDNSPAMVEKFRENLTKSSALLDIDVRCEDVRETELSNASVVVLNYTLQFLEPVERLRLLQRIQEALVVGGVLLLSEKNKFDSEAEQARLVDWHHDFKRANGYSDMEISQKRKALENVMILDTVDTHHDRLRQAGFSQSTVWFQCYNFVSFVAEK